MEQKITINKFLWFFYKSFDAIRQGLTDKKLLILNRIGAFSLKLEIMLIFMSCLFYGNEVIFEENIVSFKLKLKKMNLKGTI